jgi:hyperosmotically inducible periplasmic protein
MKKLWPRRKRLLPFKQARNGTASLSCAALFVCATSMAGSSFAADINADNTKRNQEPDSALTPLDQSNDPKDIKIVAAIRSAIVDDSGLSTNAQNLKVIVRQGTVTLRGPVDNASEKARVEKLAKNTQGVVRIDNQLSVKH